jgi:hypothetical protein
MTYRETALDDIRRVASRLGPLRERVVFLGGSVVSLLVSDPAAPDIRSTKDVDVAISARSIGEVTQLDEMLRDLGFQHSLEPGDPTCRWIVDGCKVDVIPVGNVINAYNDVWTPVAVEKAATLDIGQNITVRHVTAPYFIAIKLETFADRGAGNYLLSQDIEDIIQVLDGRPELVEEMRSSDPDLREFVTARFQSFRGSTDFLDAISAHLYPDAASQARATVILRRMDEILAG